MISSSVGARSIAAVRGSRTFSERTQRSPSESSPSLTAGSILRETADRFSRHHSATSSATSGRSSGEATGPRGA